MPSKPINAGDQNIAWRRKVAELALACAGSAPADESERLRELTALLRAAPGGDAAGLQPGDPAQVERLVEAGGALSAAAALFEDSAAGYLLSRGGGGHHLASVILPGAPEEVNASGETAALALISALALALAERGEVPARSRRPADGLRLN